MTPRKNEPENDSEYRYNIPKKSGNVSVLLKRTMEMYGDGVLEFCDVSQYMSAFLQKKKAKGKGTHDSYKSRLRSFAKFIVEKYPGISLDAFIDEIKAGKRDPYDVLGAFSYHLQFEIDERFRVDNNTVNKRVNTAKLFLRSCKCPVTTEDFKDNVDVPAKSQSDKAPIDQKDAAEFIAHAQSLRLQTAVNFMGATGPRPIEACAVRLRDLELDEPVPAVVAKVVKKAETPHITFRAEFAKTRRSRRRRLTREAANRVRIWLSEKYKPHRTTIIENGEPVTKKVYPVAQLDDLIFAVWRPDGENPKPQYLYATIGREFRDLLAALGKGQMEANGRRHEVTLHSFRRLVKSQIADNVSSDFSEWFIGHSGSTYYRRKPAEQEAAFERAEPYITYLDPTAQQGFGKDVEAKIKEKEEYWTRKFSELEAKYDALSKASVRAAENREQVDKLPTDTPVIAAGPGRKRTRS